MRYDRDFRHGRDYDDDFAADRYHWEGADTAWAGAGAGHPRARWWATARHDRSRGGGWRSAEEGAFGDRFREDRGLSAGGRQGPGRAWGMGGNVEMESEALHYRHGRDDLDRYGVGVERTPGPGGARGTHYSFGMGARTDFDGSFGAPGFDLDIGPVPTDSLRRGGPMRGQQMAGRRYGHVEGGGGRYLRGERFRAGEHGDVRFSRERYPSGAHVAYGEEYTERGPGPRGAIRRGEYAAEYGSGAYGGRAPRRGGGYSSRREWQDESRGGTGYGAGYTRGRGEAMRRAGAYGGYYDEDYGDVG